MHKLNENILKSALRSKISYNNNYHICQKSQKIFNHKYTGARMYSWDSGPGSKIIAFRGTHDSRNLLKFFNNNMVEFNIRDNRVKIHPHIFNMFYSLEHDLTKYIMDDLNSNSNTSLTFCGHSGGGSCAMLAAAYYGDLTGDFVKIKCHCFGSPKVGDANFIKWYSQNVDESINVVNKHDVVPRLSFGAEFVNNPNPIILNDHDASAWEAHDLDTYIEKIFDNITSGC